MFWLRLVEGVIVWPLLAVWLLTAMVAEPALKLPDGSVSLVSLVVKLTAPLTPVLTLKLLSTALTNTLKETPAAWLLGEPVTPTPGVRFWPGRTTTAFVAA